MKLSGKVAAITGAARGIGKACASRFLDDGVKVVISDVDAEGLAATAAELGRPDALRTVVGNVARRADVDQQVATAVKEFGRLDIMVNNAGVARNRDILEISEEEFDEIIGINLKGAFFGVQAAARQMIAQGGGGVIINMSSVNALLAIPALATYAMSKGGMKQLTLWPPLRSPGCSMKADPRPRPGGLPYSSTKRGPKSCWNSTIRWRPPGSSCLWFAANCRCGSFWASAISPSRRSNRKSRLA
ncbi:MAG: SDR family NAD(P)-dependent oxidoreductase [Bradyrhizobium sp.]|nr:MAG: SDR family NAD(P)-dependent oxidoreductase [Bradyrhizobium sp.]